MRFGVSENNSKIIKKIPSYKYEVGFFFISSY